VETSTQYCVFAVSPVTVYDMVPPTGAGFVLATATVVGADVVP